MLHDHNCFFACIDLKTIQCIVKLTLKASTFLTQTKDMHTRPFHEYTQHIIRFRSTQ